MELKVVCQCGQKYKFDMEPVNERVPFAVNCPVCNADGTATANTLLTQTFLSQTPPIPEEVAESQAIAARAGGLRINKAPNESAVPGPAAPPVSAPRTNTPSRPLASAPQNVKPVNEFNLGLGILGAVLGAALGAGLMYAFFVWADFRFPLMGTGIGVLAGLGARLLYKGTDTTLGIIAGCIALLATAGTLYLMYGNVAGLFIISMVVSVSLAYKIAG
jgi:hypothetical protein